MSSTDESGHLSAEVAEGAYRSQLPLFESCSTKVSSLLTDLLQAQDIRTHSVTSRVKDLGSLLRKMQRSSGKYRAIDDVMDVVGVRVITYFEDEVDRVAELVEEQFLVDHENSIDKREVLDPDRFGYTSLHYVVTFDANRSSLPEYKPFAAIPIEIQVRSILQHAWAEIEHDLGYKSEVQIPRSVRRRFSRLAGLLEITDEEFKAIRDDLQQYADSLPPLIKASPGAVYIDRDSVRTFLQNSQLCKSMSETIAASSPYRFVRHEDEDFDRDAKAFSTSLQEFGITTIEELESQLRTKRNLIERFALRWMSRESDDDDERDRDLSTGLGPGISLFYLQYILGAEGGSEALESYIEKHNIGGGDDSYPDLSSALLECYEEVRSELDL